MLNDFTGAAHIYIACGYTDLRRGIDGLAGIVEREFQLDPFSDSLFLFCGRRKDRIKALYWEGDGFLLLLYICPMFVAASHRRGTSHCLSCIMGAQWSDLFLQELRARIKVSQPFSH